MESTVLSPDGVEKYLKPISVIPTGLTPSGHLDNGIECILFDIYGTLFISSSGDIGIRDISAYRKSSLMDLLFRFNVQTSLSALVGEYRAIIDKTHASQKRRGVDCPEVEIDRVWREVLKQDDPETVRAFAVEFELITNPVFPMPHLLETLETCLAKNIVLGIISNAQFYTPCLFKWFFGKSVEEMGFRPGLIFYSYQTGHAKPSPHMFQRAADRLTGMGIRENAVLYVGNDMLKDVLPAKSVGFNTALFAGDTRSLRIVKEEPECIEMAPEVIITDLIQLIEHIV